MPRGKSRRLFVRFVVLLAAAALAFAGLAVFRVGPPPTVAIDAGLPGIGKATPITVRLAEPKRGLTGVRVELVQGERVEPLGEQSWTPREPWQFWGGYVPEHTIELVVGSESVKGLKEGEATLRVTAERAPTLLRHPEPVVVDKTLPVKLRPPTLQVTSSNVYVDQGGSEVVTYRVGESAVQSGVQAGAWFFPGYPLPGGDAQQRFALFGVPYDLTDPGKIALVAEDDLGNRATRTFVDRFRPRPFRNDTIRIDDAFMERVVPAILEQTPELEDRGSLLDNYLEINGELRKKNAATIVELASHTRQDFSWTREFLAMPNAAVKSDFADRRTYVYDGREVDRQDHLGYDLASTSMADIPAANDGTVVLARYFGIYGNAVVIDHGYGLQSLYGHLSRIDVEEGQQVTRGQTIGTTGATGLAGGDHLHFTMLVDGLPVNPAEWWDAHWIHDRLKLKLGPALPFGG